MKLAKPSRVAVIHWTARIRRRGRQMKQSFAPLTILLSVLIAESLTTGTAAAWVPPDTLVGTWKGIASSCGLPKDNTARSTGQHQSVSISLIVRDDGRVEGTVGGAAFRSCQVEQNRSWLGRHLHLATDYIIRGGTLDGPVVPGDPKSSREFTLPFNIQSGNIRGSVMIVERWKYPFPMLPGLSLQKVTAH